MGRQSGKIFRTTISVPLDLKERMDACDQKVNWSEVACNAFEVKLGEIARKKETADVEDLIQHFRGSGVEEAGEQQKAGYRAGQAWVRSKPPVRQLKNLERHMERVRADRYGLFDGQPNAPFGHVDYLYFAIEPRDDGDDVASASFWEGATGSDRDGLTAEYVEGFVEGALDLWDALKAKL